MSKKRPILIIEQIGTSTKVTRSDDEMPSFQGACKAAGIDPKTVINPPTTVDEKLVENYKIWEETGKYPQ